MLNLYLDYEIFVDFIKKEPVGSVLDTNFEEKEKWNKFFRFIKTECNLTILNIPDNIEFPALNLLTEGRNETNVKLNKNFKKPHKYKFDLKTEFQSIFFLREDNQKERENYIEKNPIPIAFQDGYLELFHKISLGKNERIVMDIGKKDNDVFSWQIINEYFHYVTDVVIYDNYILKNKTLAKSNIIEILKMFNSINKVLNIAVITFENYKPKLDLKTELDFIREQLNKIGIQCKLSLILLTSELREHDRGIFTNYLRLKSGDSFNFIDKKGKIITKGTELDFYPLTNSALNKANEITLKSIEGKINKTQDKNKFITFNRLLNLK